MSIITTGLANFLIILAIGIIVGLVFNRYGRGWLGRQVVNSSGVGDVTYALAGIAGSFIGFHLGVIFGLLPSSLMSFLAAIVRAAITIWLWRYR